VIDTYFMRELTWSMRRVFVMVLILLVAGCGTRSPTGPAYLARSVRLGNAPCGVLEAAGKVWVSNFGDDTLQSVDPATGKASAPVKVGDQPCGLAYGAGSVWVENYGDASLTRVEASTGKVQHTFDVGHRPYDVAFAAGAAWVTDWADGTVSRIDATTGRRTVTETSGTPTGIAPSGGSLWVALGGSGVVRIDERTGKVTQRLSLAGSPTWTAYDATSVWFSRRGGLTKVDSHTGKVLAQVPICPIPQDGAIDERGRLWVPCKDGSVWQLDSERTTRLGHWSLHEKNPFVLDAHGHTLWVPDFAGTTLRGVDTRKLPRESS
jgi:YVTN family beta-propeller protein